MRVFVDTNVWLAGRFGRGLCADLLDLLVLENVEILLDERVLAEFCRIGRDKFAADRGSLESAKAFFDRYTTVLPGADHPIDNAPDPDDAWIVAAAVIGEADVFVTGDKALLGLKRIGRMELLEPRALFLELKGLRDA